MTQEKLESLVSSGLSQREIGETLSVSQSTVKHYLKKYSLKTQKSRIRENHKDCLNCQKELSGTQEKYCSQKCRNRNNHQERNKSSYKSQKQRRWDRKEYFIDQKGGACQVCGYKKCRRALHFHHRDPKLKEFKLDSRNLGSMHLDILQREMDKCDLLCSNCHMEIHDAEDQLLKVVSVGIEPTSQPYQG